MCRQCARLSQNMAWRRLGVSSDDKESFVWHNVICVYKMQPRILIVRNYIAERHRQALCVIVLKPLLSLDTSLLIASQLLEKRISHEANPARPNPSDFFPLCMLGNAGSNNLFLFLWSICLFFSGFLGWLMHVNNFKQCELPHLVVCCGMGEEHHDVCCQFFTLRGGHTSPLWSF